MGDETYLRSHPELRWLIDKFMEVRILWRLRTALTKRVCKPRTDKSPTGSLRLVQAILLEQPENVEAFAKEFFTREGHKEEYLAMMKNQ